MNAEQLVKLGKMNDIDNYEDSIIGYLSQAKFNQLLYKMIMAYIDKLEEFDSDNAKDRIQQLKLRGYQLIDDRYANEEYITQNMITFYAAMKVYELDVRSYVADFNNEEKNATDLMVYYEDDRVINFSKTEIDKRKRETTAIQFNYSLMYGVIHEIRHAMQQKFLELYRTEYIEGMDHNAIFYWIISIQLYKDDYEYYQKIRSLFPHEYDAIIYSCREILKDIEQNFPSFSIQHLYDINSDIANYIYTLNSNLEKTCWYPSLKHFNGIYHARRSALSSEAEKTINNAMATYSNASFQDDEMARFMRGEYSECLDMLPHLKDGALKTTNLFDVIRIYSEERTRESSDEYFQEEKRAYQK